MILSSQVANKKLSRMALEIIENNINSHQDLVLVGIKENGFAIAKLIAQKLAEILSIKVPIVGLQIDKKNPIAVNLDSETSLENKRIVLIDDVSNSGKTMLYAIIPLLALNPAEIQTLVLVERTYITFPIALNYVGLSVSTTENEFIEVIISNNEIMGATIKN
jgi:pyrimidine operon attenuation protein / uracil phosphoribosyltransferase